MKFVRVVLTVALSASPALADSGARADSRENWMDRPKAAFIDAYVFACQPVEFDFAGSRAPLSDAARQVYQQGVLDKYGDNCSSFYFEEVVPRLAKDQRPRLRPH
jgi:hypothetical protein